MAVKRKPAKKAARTTDAKRAAIPKAKGKTMAAGRVRAAAKRRPAALKPKVAKSAAAKPKTFKAKTTPVRAAANARAVATQPTPKNRPVARQLPVAEPRTSAMMQEEAPRAEGTVAQPAAGVTASTTAEEENGTPGLPVPIASFTI